MDALLAPLSLPRFRKEITIMKTLRILTASVLFAGALSACNADPTAPVAPGSVRAGRLSIPGTGPAYNGVGMGSGNFSDEGETQMAANEAVAGDSVTTERWGGIFGSGN
ncbi:MAG TPA: hypothetical protein VFX98_11995 [Longimicrobiaceae bacterium]|nr:hypothetical protein [Longimicrobiaceae bacterium]